MRMYDLQAENERLLRDIASCEAKLEDLHERNHEVVRENERLDRKLRLPDEARA